MSQAESTKDDTTWLELSSLEYESVHRSRSISVKSKPDPQFGGDPYIGSVYQSSCGDGTFADPPQLRIENRRSFTRREWETIKRAVDQAFDAFEQKWPRS